MILPKKILRFTSRQCLLLAGLILLEFVFSAWLYKTLKYREEQIHYSIFESHSKEITASINKEISVNLEKVISLEGLFDVAYPVSRDNFRTFTGHLIRSGASINALEWIPRINKKDKDLFEIKTRETGLDNFFIGEKKGESLHPAGLRNEYFPVTFIEPVKGNEKALGFDLASNPVRFKAMKKADSANRLILTEPVNLIQGDSSKIGVLAFYPFKKNGKLLGYFSGVFKIEDLISKSSDAISKNDFMLNVYDRQAGKNNHILLSAATEQPSKSFFSRLARQKGKNYRQVIKVADRE